MGGTTGLRDPGASGRGARPAGRYGAATAALVASISQEG